jgi:hypothetical protein
MSSKRRVRSRFLKVALLLVFACLVLSCIAVWSVGSQLSAPANHFVQIPSELDAEEVRISGDAEIAGSLTCTN